MTVVVEGKNSFFMADRAVLLSPTREVAWAADHVFNNPAYGWVLGKFVEAERENANRAFWSVDDLVFGQPSIQNAPMNLLHQPRQIVGSFVASEILYPLKDEGADPALAEILGEEAATINPHIEALGAFWKAYFPRQYQAVAAAHDEGSLFYSMECVAESLTCGGDEGCGKEFAYDGPQSATYCQHLNERSSRRHMNNPWFTGGALIIPPKTPAWADAKISELSSLVKEHQEECEAAYDAAAEMAPNLGPKEWEHMMFQLMELSRDVSPEERKKLAGKNQAMPDGSYPIASVQDLRNAIQAIGRAKDPAAVKAHIKARARALGHPELIPDNWK